MLKKIIPFTPIDIIARKREILETLKRGPLSWRQIATNTHTVQDAFLLMQSTALSGKRRLEIAALLEPFGVFIHGNLNPKGKPFKPEKVLPFDFHHTAPILRVALLESLKKAGAYIAQFPGLEKRGALVANLSFNVTVLVGTEKIRKNITVPVHKEGMPIQSIAERDAKRIKRNGHAENAFWYHVSQAATVKRLLQTVKHTVEEGTPGATVYKLNAVVSQLSGSYEMCDPCHEGSSKALRVEFKQALELGARGLRIRVPKNHDGIAMGLQYTYAFSPAAQSDHSYTKPALFEKRRAPRNNFYSDQVIGQSRMGKFDSISADDLPSYTLFVSNGPDYDERHQWYFTGEVVNLGERSGACTRCSTAIQFEHTIQNYISGEVRVIGSQCIKKYQEEFDVLDTDDVVVEDEAERAKIVKGQKTLLKKIEAIKESLRSPEISGELQVALDGYLLNGFLSPKEAAIVIAAMTDDGVSDLAIEEVEGESFTDYSLEELTALEDYCAKGKRKLKKLVPKIQEAKEAIEERIREEQVRQKREARRVAWEAERIARQAKVAAQQDFLKRMSAKIAQKSGFSNWNLDESYTQYRCISFGHLRHVVMLDLIEADKLILRELSLKDPTEKQFKDVTAPQLRKIQDLLPDYYQRHSSRFAPILAASSPQGPYPGGASASAFSSPSPSKRRRVDFSPAQSTPRKTFAELRSALCKLNKEPQKELLVLQQLKDLQSAFNQFPEELKGTLQRSFGAFIGKNQARFPAICKLMSDLLALSKAER